MDTQLVNLLAQIKGANKPPLWQGTATQARLRPMLMDSVFGPVPPVDAMEHVFIPSSQGHALRLRLYTPTTPPKGLIVYLHGGGWVLGSVDSFHPFTATLSQRSGCAVLSVDYRLAPEAPFPLPLDDACAAIAWASVEGQARTGTCGLPLMVMGDSAGANLATTAARLHNEQPGRVPVGFQILAYPVTDCDFDRPSYRSYAEGYLLTRRDMIWFWDQYQPDTQRRTDPLASPLRCTDLSASPRALILTAELDPLRDEGQAYCARLQASGVRAELVNCQGLVHGFLAMINLVPSAAWAFERILQQISLETDPH